MAFPQEVSGCNERMYCHRRTVLARRQQILAFLTWWEGDVGQGVPLCCVVALELIIHAQEPPPCFAFPSTFVAHAIMNQQIPPSVMNTYLTMFSSHNLLSKRTAGPLWTQALTCTGRRFKVLGFLASTHTLYPNPNNGQQLKN